MDRNRLTLAIITVDRQPPYVHRALASMFAADPCVHELPCVHLVIGTRHAEYLDEYRHHRILRLHPLSEEAHERMADWTVYRKFCRNYVRSLSLPIPDGGGICVCEDDVVFRDRFLQRLVATINEMENEAGLRDYCLALFSAYDFERDPALYRGRRFCKYGYSFYGTPCMYYPKHVAAEVREHLQRQGVENPTKPGDLLIRDLYGDRMYACPRALADHVGRVSTGLGGGGGSPTFGRPYVLLRREDWGRPHPASTPQEELPASIPKVFHRIWVGRSPLPATADRFAASWQERHPDWEMRLWTDDDLPQELFNASIIEGTAEPAQKADILRHELLYRFGGVYIDADFECLRNIEPLIEEVAYFYGDQLPGVPGTAILGSVPRHPFARLCLERMAERWPWTPGQMLEDTGPGFFRRALLAYLGQQRRSVPFIDPLSQKLAGNLLVPTSGPPLHAFHPWVLYPYYLGQQWAPEDHPAAYAAHHWHKAWD